jgi:hypothetical protein
VILAPMALSMARDHERMNQPNAGRVVLLRPIRSKTMNRIASGVDRAAHAQNTVKKITVLSMAGNLRRICPIRAYRNHHLKFS